MTPFDTVQGLLWLNGAPLKLDPYPYLRAIYNTTAREVGLFTGRQVSKSTTLSSILTSNAVTAPGSVSMFVAPLADQTDVFSLQRLREFIYGSPIIANGLCRGPLFVDQVYRKTFANRSSILLGYAQRTADRLRGRSIVSGDPANPLTPNAAAYLMFDEIQDILPDVIPIIKETAFRTTVPRFMYCGTPKSRENHMERYRSRSTGSEWAVRCQATGCKKWNMEWDERNIGNTGVICRHCGQPLNTDLGDWVDARRLDPEKGKDSKVSMESYRISQLIVKPIMDDPFKWRELLDKLRDYSTAQFRNEVLGLSADTGSKPVTIDQLRACCEPDRPNALPGGLPNLPPLIMGVDWAIVGEASRTAVVIGGWDQFPHRFQVYYYKVFKGLESDPMFQIDWITKVAQDLNIQLVACDWGMGQVQNITLSNTLGADRVVQLWHTAMNGAGGRATRVKWEPKTRKYHLARTRVLTDTFEALRHGQVRTPRESECDILHSDLLAEGLEYSDTRNTVMYVNAEPDDCLHALTYAMLGGELYLTGNFASTIGSPTVSLAQASEAWEMNPDPTIDSLYG